MHVRLLVMLLSVLAMVAPLAAAPDTNAVAVVQGKAAELTQKLAARAEKIAALHAFVRDDIREMSTQYG